MPYAVYSKRTKVVSRIIHDLSSLQPGESIIEVDDDISFMRNFSFSIEGQAVNSLGHKLFLLNDNVSLTTKSYDFEAGIEPPRLTKYDPLYIKYTTTGRLDFPIFANPFGWTAEELAHVKYETILAKNYPYQVIIGEEFINTDHIDLDNSEDFVLSEGKCILKPGGFIRTIVFYFRMQKRIGSHEAQITSREDVYFNQFVFDTAYLMVKPELIGGVNVSFKADPWSLDITELPNWTNMITDDEVDVAGIVNTGTGGKTGAGLAANMCLKFENLTTEPFALENYVLLLRWKKYRDHTAGPIVIPAI
jgi:hypothetical protein